MTLQSFSTLQRVEIAEIDIPPRSTSSNIPVSVLFNESKLPKSPNIEELRRAGLRFSTLQRVEIAEIARAW